MHERITPKLNSEENVSSKSLLSERQYSHPSFERVICSPTPTDVFRFNHFAPSNNTATISHVRSDAYPTPKEILAVQATSLTGWDERFSFELVEASASSPICVEAELDASAFVGEAGAAGSPGLLSTADDEAPSFPVTSTPFRSFVAFAACRRQIFRGNESSLQNIRE